MDYHNKIRVFTIHFTIYKAPSGPKSYLCIMLHYLLVLYAKYMNPKGFRKMVFGANDSNIGLFRFEVISDPRKSSY